MNAATLHRRRYRGTDPKRKAIGWGVVVAVHALVGWALVSGTARRGLELIKKPMEAAVIQEVIIPPPPPPPPPPPKKIEAPPPQTPKVVAPPPPYVPPPEVAPPVSQSAVAVQSVPTPPVTPPVITPPPPPAPPAPPAPAAAPARQDMTVACPEQVRPEMPRQALREGTQGIVKAQAVIRDGVVKDVTILSGPRVYHAPVRAAMMQYRCISGGEVIATQEFVFKID